MMQRLMAEHYLVRFWIKDITANSYKFIYSSDIKEGEPIKWSRCGITGHLEGLVYRTFDVLESPEERECFERLEVNSKSMQWRLLLENVPPRVQPVLQSFV
ncbi:hypothetical protein [Shewanella sp. Actino-trap-3]|uniref:hypothetical protein n=1 Tax=Shewanella sp. Actino-trap-3 TaxID=2058331 RepID=UPI0012FF3CA8|nr:hypothetical protein [Shewanella sp. Actino-trap-3]